jgi:hypothetical protein
VTSAASALTPRELLLVDAIAERVAERLSVTGEDRRRPWSPQLADARAVAHALGVDIKTVYRHAGKLGAVRVGRRLRFDLDRALRSWSSGESDRCPSEKSQLSEKRVPNPTSGAYQSAADASHCQLLPVGRRTEAQRA